MKSRGYNLSTMLNIKKADELLVCTCINFIMIMRFTLCAKKIIVRTWRRSHAVAFYRSFSDISVVRTVRMHIMHG